MHKLLTGLLAASLAGGLAGALPTQATAAAPAAPAAATGTPRWVTHVQRFPGSLSGAVRAQADPARSQQRPAGVPALAPRSTGPDSSGNVQMNGRDSQPPLPQNETAVAASLDDPDVAVAAANDYVNGGVVVMRTLDGGRSWSTTYVSSEFHGTGDFCNGGDPGLAYSRRDHAFYLSQLCFFRGAAVSEVQVYASTDNGLRWTPGRQSAVVVTNVNAKTGAIDDSVFNDKELIAVDNTPTSPHFGRLYVTYTKFHLVADGSSDYCPLQLGWTDRVVLGNPVLTSFHHTAISPDDPGGKGLGRSANQFSFPVVEPDGTLDVGFVQEACNSSADAHLLFQRSTDGGRSFLAHPVQIDKPGQYRDNPSASDLPPPTAFRAPNTISMTWSQGRLSYVYQNGVHRATSGADISLQQSGDGGRTWSDSRVLSATAAGPASNDQFLPAITSLPDGRLYAIWFDRRLSPTNRDIDTWEARSADAGRTWSSSRISSTSWNPDHGFFTSGAFLGDYNGIAVSSTHVYPVWTDGRNSAFGRTGIGETDVFTDVERP